MQDNASIIPDPALVRSDPLPAGGSHRNRLSGGTIEWRAAALTLLERCADRKAKLVITGVGKSGIVARKIAATFSSIG